MSVVYGTLYLCFAAFPVVFQQGRGWNAGQGGLAFLGILVGFIIGLIVFFWDNTRYMKLCRKTTKVIPPEIRLPPAIVGGACIVIGLAWFAATNGPNIHWASPIVAGVPMGTGFVLVFVCNGNYLFVSLGALTRLNGNMLIRCPVSMRIRYMQLLSSPVTRLCGPRLVAFSPCSQLICIGYAFLFPSRPTL